MLSLRAVGTADRSPRSPRTVAQLGLVAVSVGGRYRSLATLDVKLDEHPASRSPSRRGRRPARLAAGQRDRVARCREAGRDHAEPGILARCSDRRRRAPRFPRDRLQPAHPPTTRRSAGRTRDTMSRPRPRRESTWSVRRQQSTRDSAEEQARAVAAKEHGDAQLDTLPSPRACALAACPSRSRADCRHLARERLKCARRAGGMA